MPAPVAVAAPATNAPAPVNGAAKPAVAPTKAPPPPVAATEQKYSVKVDGQVVEMTMAEMERYASKGRYADKATQEAKEAIKAAKKAASDYEARERARLEKVKGDPDAWLREHGIDPDEYAKSKLEKKVAEGKMTPEQKRAAELEAENKRLKAEQDKLTQQHEAEQKQQLTSHLQKRIETELASAAKRAGMSIGDESFYAIYESFREAHDLGLLPVDAAGLQPHHADRIIEEAQARLENAQRGLRENALKLKGQELLEFVGKEAVDAILVARLEQIRAAKGQPPAPRPAGAPVASAATPRKYLTLAEADAQLKQIGQR